MTYTIFDNTVTGSPMPICNVDSMEAAEAWARDKAEKMPCDPEVFFELDEDGKDAADIVIFTASQALTYTVEAA